MTRFTVSSKGQVVIPQQIRAAYGIKPGDKIHFMPHGDHMHVTKADDSLAVFLDGPKQPVGAGNVEKLLGERVSLRYIDANAFIDAAVDDWAATRAGFGPCNQGGSLHEPARRRCGSPRNSKAATWWQKQCAT